MPPQDDASKKHAPAAGDRPSTDACPDDPGACFERVLGEVKEGSFQLKEVEPAHCSPCLPKDTPVDLSKFDVGALHADLGRHHALRHVVTSDTTGPRVPMHTKLLRDNGRQKLLREIESKRLI